MGAQPKRWHADWVNRVGHLFSATCEAKVMPRLEDPLKTALTASASASVEQRRIILGRVERHRYSKGRQ